MGVTTVGSEEFGGPGEPLGRAAGEPGLARFGGGPHWESSSSHQLVLGRRALTASASPAPASGIGAARLLFIIHSLELI